MTTEHEVLSVHQASLRQARECCQRLQRLAVELAPSGRMVRELRGHLKAIEGTCRQLGHMRGDARWFRLASVYAGDEKQIAASRTGQELRAKPSALRLAMRFQTSRNWQGYGQLAQLFELGLRRSDELANEKTERPGTLILPPWAIQ